MLENEKIEVMRRSVEGYAKIVEGMEILRDCAREIGEDVAEYEVGLSDARHKLAQIKLLYEMALMVQNSVKTVVDKIEDIVFDKCDYPYSLSESNGLWRLERTDKDEDNVITFTLHVNSPLEEQIETIVKTLDGNIS